MNKKANDEFEKKIDLTAAERVLTKEREKSISIQAELFKAEVEYRKAQEDTRLSNETLAEGFSSSSVVLGMLTAKIADLKYRLAEAKEEYDAIYNVVTKLSGSLTKPMGPTFEEAQGPALPPSSATEEEFAEAQQK